MIPLHRLSDPDHPFYVNPDLIHSVEATPDTVITMTNQSRLVVADPVDEVLERIRAWRAGIFARAMGVEPAPPAQPLAEVLPIAAGLS
jgi:flagellar protein FlbD